MRVAHDQGLNFPCADGEEFRLHLALDVSSQLMVNGPLRWVFCLTGETVCEGDGGK